MPRLPSALCAFLTVAGAGCGDDVGIFRAADGGRAGTDVGRGEGGGTADGGPKACSFTVAAQLSTKIQTVGIVSWSVDLSGLQSARIDFGPTVSYGMIAPVDLKAADHRTLLLGMKQETTYHYRIVAENGSTECASQDQTLTTGSLLAGLPRIMVLDESRAWPLFGGFLLTGQYLPVPPGGMPAYIADADGELVWAYPFVKDVTSARMSYDGKHVWLNNANTPSTQGAVVHRVAMDGTSDEDLSDRFVGLNHQLTVLPDETVVFYAYGPDGCDDVKEYSPATGTVRTIVNTATAQGSYGACHIVNIQYWQEDDSLVFSDRDNQMIVKIRRRDGATVWVLGSPHATIAGAPWVGAQHGVHLLGLDRLLVFNNNMRSVATGPAGTGDGSIVMELSLDLTAMTATEIWSYKADPGIPNEILGDVRRLPNGNTIVAYSTKGVLHEVAPDGTLLQEWTWPLGASFGYVEKRATLYGPPPR